MGEFPTQKQERFAQLIANTLGIDLPNIKTKQSYWQFIRENKDIFQTKMNQYDEEDMYMVSESNLVGHIPGDL